MLIKAFSAVGRLKQSVLLLLVTLAFAPQGTHGQSIAGGDITDLLSQEQQEILLGGGRNESQADIDARIANHNAKVQQEQKMFDKRKEKELRKLNEKIGQLRASGDLEQAQELERQRAASEAEVTEYLE